jgi:hypothetical protein
MSLQLWWCDTDIRNSENSVSSVINSENEET